MSDPTPPPSAPKKRRPAARKHKPAKKVAAPAPVDSAKAEASPPVNDANPPPSAPVDGANRPLPRMVEDPGVAVPEPAVGAPATAPVTVEHTPAEAGTSHKASGRSDSVPESRRSDPAPSQPKTASRPSAPTPVAQPRAPAPAAAASTTPAPLELIRVPLSVRWRDLDAFNHVNNSKYLSYLEEARLRWMMTMPGMGLDDNVAPVVAASNLNYRRPISWPGEVTIELFVERIGNTSVTVGHRILDAGDSTVVYCDGNVVMVWIDRQSGRAAPLPEAVRASCTRAARSRR